jgi:hypothetical protein
LPPSKVGFSEWCERHIAALRWVLGMQFSPTKVIGWFLVKFNQVKRMAEQCFKKQGLNPPICGVHNGQLVQTEVRIDQYAPQLGRVSVLAGIRLSCRRRPDPPSVGCGCGGPGLQPDFRTPRRSVKQETLGNLCTGHHFCSPRSLTSIWSIQLSKMARNSRSSGVSFISGGRFPASGDTTPPAGPAACGVGRG